MEYFYYLYDLFSSENDNSLLEKPETFKEELFKLGKNKWNGHVVKNEQGQDVFIYCCAKPSLGADLTFAVKINNVPYFILSQHKSLKRPNLSVTSGGNTDSFVSNSSEEEKTASDMSFGSPIPCTLSTAIRETKEETSLNIELLDKKNSPLGVKIEGKEYRVIELCTRSSKKVNPGRTMAGVAYYVNLGEYNSIQDFKKTFKTLQPRSDVGKLLLTPFNKEAIEYKKENKYSNESGADKGNTILLVKPKFEINRKGQCLNNNDKYFVDWDKAGVLNNAIAQYYIEELQNVQNIKNKSVSCERVEVGGIAKFEGMLEELSNSENIFISSLSKKILKRKLYDNSLNCLDKTFRKTFSSLLERVQNKEKHLKIKRKRSNSVGGRGNLGGLFL